MSKLRPPSLTRRGVLGAAGAVGGAAVFSGVAFAGPEGPQGPDGATSGTGDGTPDPARPKREFRGSWIATTVNIDWPSKPGLDVDTQKAEYQRLLDDAAEFELNAVVTQIRPTGDAFWPSPLEPWSRWLTGEQGKDPGYDPLAYAIDATHAAGLDFHAWLNPYRISMTASNGDVGVDPSKLHESHPARRHPEWVVAYPKTDGQLYYNPGIPEVREFVVEAMMHAVDNYDIDGVHFDDYFYPYPVGDEDFDDAAAFAEYGGDFDTLADWRRANTDALIQEFGRRIKESRPWVRFGVSPFGVWRNVADDPDGSDTEAGSPTYDVLYADTRKWVKEGWIDYIAPQIYWAISLEIASYQVLVEWWNQLCADTDCQLFIGEATYKVDVDEASPEWKNDPRELLNHVTLCRE
ncbi:MAG: glycoside hydrolase family 10 protein, partial [Stackebrandtia sp.]